MSIFLREYSCYMMIIFDHIKYLNLLMENIEIIEVGVRILHMHKYVYSEV